MARTSQPGRAHAFGVVLRAAVRSANEVRDDFIASAVAELSIPKLTAERWYDGKNVPNTDYRGWIERKYGVDSKLAGNVENGSEPPAVREPTPRHEAYLSYALGSLQSAAIATDDEIVHDVRSSLSDDKQSPWMKMAVTLIRQAFQRG